MKKDYLPGWLLMLGVVLVSIFISRLIVIRGNHPIETSLLTIVIGILLRNIRLVPKMCLPGVKAFEKLLILGIVLIGAFLNYKTIGSQGLNMLVVIVATMSIRFFIIYLLGRFFLLPKPLALLLSVGTTICSGSAIAVTAPLI
ncbi:MAG: putative sulfate exporter family transporter, partial [Candidatus Aminicenantales bacterium]